MSENIRFCVLAVLARAHSIQAGLRPAPYSHGEIPMEGGGGSETADCIWLGARVKVTAWLGLLNVVR